MSTNQVSSNGERSNLLSLCLSNQDIGQVASIFRHSFNVVFPNIYFHVGRVTDSLSCLGVTLPDQQVAEQIMKIQIGDKVRVLKEKMYIYTSQDVLCVPLNSLEEVNLMVPRGSFKIDGGTLKEVWQYADFEQNWGLINTKPDEVIQQIIGGNESIKKVVEYLFGRGKGLTPSGDDMLVGILTVLRAGKMAAWQMWSKAINMQLNHHQTTDVATAYLRAALNGYASKKLVDLIIALQCGDSVTIQRAVKALKDFGHTSGTDTLFGFYCGLKIIMLSE